MRAFLVCAADRGRCPGDGSSREGGGVGSQAPVPSRILLDLQRREISVVLDGGCVVPGRWRSVTPRPPRLRGDLRFSRKQVNPIYVSE